VTPAEVARLLAMVEKRWPHAPLPLGSGDVWLEDLADVPAEEVRAAVTDYARAGERFPPTSGYVRSEVLRRAQVAPPSFDDAQRIVARLAASCIPYDASGPEDTATTIERMAARGVHEAVLRWVQMVGVYAIRHTPDPELQPLDIGQMADRRDRARHFDREVLPAWREDPRPGLSLARAREALEAPRRGELRAIDSTRHLPEATA
jgi:hypothetical protein